MKDRAAGEREAPNETGASLEENAEGRTSNPEYIGATVVGLATPPATIPNLQSGSARKNRELI
jgi:hypothetical protein